jgi:hypothetical protein
MILGLRPPLKIQDSQMFETVLPVLPAFDGIRGQCPRYDRCHRLFFILTSLKPDNVF